MAENKLLTTIRKVLGGSRFLIIIAVIVSYLTAAMIIIYSAFLLFHILINLVLYPDLSSAAGRHLIVACIELIDSFLLGTAFYIVAIGLYELFIDRRVRTLSWLQVQNLDELKGRLLAVITVVLSIFFLEQVINWNGKSDILALGIAEALIIGAIALAVKLQFHPASQLDQRTGPPDEQSGE